MSWVTHCRTATAALRVNRSFSTSSAVAFPRARKRSETRDVDEFNDADLDPGEPMDEMGIMLEELQSHQDEGTREGEDDTTSAGHLMIMRQREKLTYMRLIDHEMPQLVAFRKPFVPPTSEAPVAVRSITYLGEDHPAANKRVLTVPVAHLPLKDDKAVHKLKLLAGPRWSPSPPKDGGFRKGEAAKEGYVKIACEEFPQPNMNLKWASDTLDRLVAEANDSSDTFADVPLDLRHIDAKAMKAGKGKFRRDLAGGRVRSETPPSIRDFPKSWLPKLPKQGSPPTPSTPSPSLQ